MTLDVQALGRALTNVIPPQGERIGGWYAADVAREYEKEAAALARHPAPSERRFEPLELRGGDERLEGYWEKAYWEIVPRLAAALARQPARSEGLRERIETLPRYTSPDGEETWVEWAALRDLLTEVPGWCGNNAPEGLHCAGCDDYDPEHVGGLDVRAEGQPAPSEGLPYLATMLAAWYDAFGEGDRSMTYYALTNDRVSKLRDAIRYRIDNPASEDSRVARDAAVHPQTWLTVEEVLGVITGMTQTSWPLDRSAEEKGWNEALAAVRKKVAALARQEATDGD